jgi:hypothetical protein
LDEEANGDDEQGLHFIIIKFQLQSAHITISPSKGEKQVKIEE